MSAAVALEERSCEGRTGERERGPCPDVSEEALSKVCIDPSIGQCTPLLLESFFRRINGSVTLRWASFERPLHKRKEREEGEI